MRLVIYMLCVSGVGGVGALMHVYMYIDIRVYKGVFVRN